MKKIIAFLFLLSILIACQHSPQAPVKITAKTNSLDTVIRQDSSIIQMVAPYRTKLKEEVNRVISYASDNFTKSDGEMQSTLSNLMAAMMFEKSAQLFKEKTGKELDFVLSNHGGIRAPLWKGDLKVKDAFNLMPFDNTLVVVELTPEKVADLFSYFIEKERAHPISKHIQITISKNKKASILVHGKPIENRNYFVATSNYLQKGGDNMKFFADPVSLYDSNFLIRDAIIEYFSKRDTIDSQLDSRVTILNN